ncbi:MAG: metalloregulator ArsR/SmtB family transcription factor [Eubacteriales bacterium]|nr:metalloregulator ArsR/SmtB family transcription factor [Eubacteriales bacterium]MDD4583512.1 metalloregulator ArsR/SmtB family transcription factor [Eubacteriales bacterium]
MRLRKELDDFLEEDVLLTARVSDALAHPARVRIFRYIFIKNRNRTPVCNKDVVAAFDYSQATISQHIKKLVGAELVQVKRENKFSFYYVNIGNLGKYLDAVKKFG